MLATFPRPINRCAKLTIPQGTPRRGHLSLRRGNRFRGRGTLWVSIRGPAEDGCPAGPGLVTRHNAPTRATMTNNRVNRHAGQCRLPLIHHNSAKQSHSVSSQRYMQRKPRSAQPPPQTSNPVSEWNPSGRAPTATIRPLGHPQGDAPGGQRLDNRRFSLPPIRRALPHRHVPCSSQEIRSAECRAMTSKSLSSCRTAAPARSAGTAMRQSVRLRTVAPSCRHER